MGGPNPGTDWVCPRPVSIRRGGETRLFPSSKPFCPANRSQIATASTVQRVRHLVSHEGLRLTRCRMNRWSELITVDDRTFLAAAL
jgi:hypothetical protein